MIAGVDPDVDLANQETAACGDCGESLRVVVRDAVIEQCEPEGIVSYVEVPFNQWSKDWAFT